MEKKRGRPTLPEREKRKERLVLLFTKAEYKALEEEARAQGHHAVSSWARALLLTVSRGGDAKA